MRMAIGCIQLSNWAARIRGGPGDIALALDGATAFCLADGGEDVLGCLQLPDSVFQLAHQPGAPVEAVALRRCDRDFILALVVARDQRHAHDLADRHGAADDRDGQHDDQELESQSASQDPAVAAVEETVDEPRLRSRLMAVAGFARFQLEEPAAQHGGQGERNEQAHRHGEGDRQPEAGEEAADDPA